MYWFTSDEHYGHKKIIEYCNRPFSSIEEMNTVIINNFNSVVDKNDITLHAGDFCWSNKEPVDLIRQLNGNHIFLKGSHDHWLSDSSKYMWRKMFGETLVVVCHYCMRTWERSHYNSWQLFGHSHGRLQGIGKQYDIGVDNNKFYPVSFDQIVDIMSGKENNFNYIEKIKNEHS